jgi:Cysteine-rich CWC
MNVMTRPGEVRCPRCDGGFHCGANDSKACACTGMTLDAALQLRLRERFADCLCVSCLHAVAAGATLDIEHPYAAGSRFLP